MKVCIYSSLLSFSNHKFLINIARKKLLERKPDAPQLPKYDTPRPAPPSSARFRDFDRQRQMRDARDHREGHREGSLKDVGRIARVNSAGPSVSASTAGFRVDHHSNQMHAGGSRYSFDDRHYQRGDRDFKNRDRDRFDRDNRDRDRGREWVDRDRDYPGRDRGDRARERNGNERGHRGSKSSINNNSNIYR